ncbi:MAG: phosphoglycerate kinase [Alphaproteobacteria bacterium]
MAAFKTLDDVDVSGRRVLVRGDLNVPVADGKVSDATRLERLAPTVNDLLAKGASVIVTSHFGRPKGKPDATMSLRPVAEALAGVLGRPVAFAEDCIGPKAEAAAGILQPGQVLVLENLRFHKGEEANDADFSKALAKLADIYVNDGFSVSHRAHASVEGIAHLLPAVAGRNMQAELSALTAALESPQRPVAAIVGGAKVSTKLDVLGHLLSRVDMVIIGGGMANTFLHALGTDIGASLCEKDLAATARDILAKADETGTEIVLPADAVIAAKLEPGAATAVVPIAAVPADRMILDIGPASAAALAKTLEGVKTLLWNGPLGAFEVPPFDAATVQVARAAAALTKAGKLVSVGGGGDTVAALRQAGVADDFTYVSTAGGAFLEWLEGRVLPGVAALQQG